MGYGEWTNTFPGSKTDTMNLDETDGPIPGSQPTFTRTFGSSAAKWKINKKARRRVARNKTSFIAFGETARCKVTLFLFLRLGTPFLQ